MMTTTFTFDVDKGLPMDDVAAHNGITIIDPTCHIKVWRNSATRVVTVAIVPKNGKLAAPYVIRGTSYFDITPAAVAADGPEPFYCPKCKKTHKEFLASAVWVNRQAVECGNWFSDDGRLINGPGAERPKNKTCRHHWKAIEDPDKRRPSNWCGICCDWYEPEHH